MKAMLMPAVVSRPISPRKVLKAKSRKCQPYSSDDGDAMECLFGKLVAMIPTIPRGHKLTKLQILQCVIEYIQELECQVQFHPEAENLSSGLNCLRISLKSMDL